MSENSQHCGACGAPIKIDQNLNKIICSYCNNEIQITQKVKITSNDFKGEQSDLTKFNNLLLLLENAEESSSYNEGLDYCNKALEIDPSNPKLWEYKAICYFWSIENKITKFHVDQVYKFLKNTKKYSKEFNSNNTFKTLAYNLYSSVYNSYLKLDYDKSKSGKIWDSFSENSINIIIDFIKTMELCYELYPDQNFLSVSINELSGYSKLKWIIIDNGQAINNQWVTAYNIDPIKIRESQIEIIKKEDSNYIPPEIYMPPTTTISKSNSKCFVATTCYGDYNHPSIRVLRRYRDEILLKNTYGRKFILFYYKHGPILSRFIEDNTLMKNVIRKLLINPIVYIIRLVYI